MRKRVLIAFAVVFVIFAGLASWQAVRTRELIYQGKTLSTWLEGYTPDPRERSYQPLAEQPRWKQADAAVRALGTNSIPSLLRMLRANDPAWKLWLLRLASKQRLVKISFVPAAELNLRATMAFGSLGESASNCVPALIRIYEENYSPESQNCVVNALRGIGPGAARAGPCLVVAACSSTSVMRYNALAALGEVHAQPELALPVLIDALSDADSSARGAAACSLRDFGADAKRAVPALLVLLKDSDEYASSLAAEALEHIDPEGAAKALEAYRSRWQ